MLLYGLVEFRFKVICTRSTGNKRANMFKALFLRYLNLNFFYILEDCEDDSVLRIFSVCMARCSKLKFKL